jgi:hypothetical protein
MPSGVETPDSVDNRDRSVLRRPACQARRAGTEGDKRMRFAKPTYRTFVRGVCGALVTAVAAIVFCAVPPSAAADVFVVERDSGTVRHYSAGGVDLGVFVSGLDHPGALTADGSGNIYVSESFAGRSTSTPCRERTS